MNDPKNALILQMQKTAQELRKNRHELAAQNKELRQTNEALWRIIALLMRHTKPVFVVDMQEFNKINPEFTFDQNIGGNVIIRYIGKEN